MSPSDVNRTGAPVGPLVGVTTVGTEKNAVASRSAPDGAIARSGSDAAGKPSGVDVDVKTMADATTPPVDAERVAQIRAALADGSYPLVPTQIADALVAARLMLSAEQ